MLSRFSIGCVRGFASKLRAVPAAITLTPSAITRLDNLLQKQRAAAGSLDAKSDSIVGLKLGVKGRGCNGLSYTMNYATSKDVGMLDEVVQATDDIQVIIDHKALLFILGTEMDYVETDLGSEFTFNNPNSKGECGCGESFNV